MKKVLKIGHLGSLGQGSMILAYRSGETLTVQNLELNPSDRIKFEKTKTELIIRVQLSDNEFLALDEEKGIAEKITL